MRQCASLPQYGLKSWIEAAKKRLHPNVLAIALANKLALIAWAVLARGGPCLETEIARHCRVGAIRELLLQELLPISSETAHLRGPRIRQRQVYPVLQGGLVCLGGLSSGTDMSRSVPELQRSSQ